MDADTIDQEYEKLQTEFQDVAANSLHSRLISRLNSDKTLRDHGAK